MKHKFKTTAQILVVVAAVAILATAAFAYTNPSGPAPSGNVPAPVNTGTFMQTKLGDLGLAGVGTGNLFAAINGWFGQDVIANRGIFGINSSNQASLASSNLTSYITDILFAQVSGKGIAVDSTGNTTITGPLAITSGTPVAGAVLTSDASGNATWQTPANLSPTQTLNVQYFEQDSGPQVTDVTVNCPLGTQLVGGGGHCDFNGSGSAQGLLTDSRPTSTTGNPGWYVHCGGTGNPAAHAFAICANLAAPVVVQPAWSAPTGYSQMTSGSGSYGQGCSSIGGGNSYAVHQHTSSADYFLQNSCLYAVRPGTMGTTQCYVGAPTNTGSSAANLRPVTSCNESTPATNYTLYHN